MHSISMPTQDHLIEATTLHCTAQRRTRKSSPPLMPLPPRRTRSTRPAVHLPAPCIATRVPRPGNAPRRHRGTRAKLWSRWPPLNPRSRISITSPRRRRTVNHARTHERIGRAGRPGSSVTPVTSPAGDERTDRSMRTMPADACVQRSCKRRWRFVPRGLHCLLSDHHTLTMTHPH